MVPFITIILLVLIALMVFASCIRIVPQAQAMVVERLGAYLDTWGVGIHFKVPFVDRVAKRVLLKEQVVDFPPQPFSSRSQTRNSMHTVWKIRSWRLRI